MRTQAVDTVQDRLSWTVLAAVSSAKRSSRPYARFRSQFSSQVMDKAAASLLAFRFQILIIFRWAFEEELMLWDRERGIL